MEIKHINSFVFVAETGSFSIAASRCYLTQSAISQHIKTLEDELNCKLLIRNSHDITLTENGEELLPRAKEILKQVDDCKEHINAINNCYTGELRIGVGFGIAPYIRKAAMTFIERYPNVRPNAEFSKAEVLNKRLREHQLDIAFTMNTAYNDEGIESISCVPFTICAMMSKSHPLASLEKVSYDDLMRYGVIMPDVGERVFNTIQKFFDKDISKLDVKCIVNNPDEMLRVVESSYMITFLPKMYLRDHPLITARPIEGLECQLMSNVHWMKDVPLKRSAQLLIDIVREEVAQSFLI